MDFQFQLVDISRQRPDGKSVETATNSWSISLAAQGKEKEQSNFEPTREQDPFLGSCMVLNISAGQDSSIIAMDELKKAWQAAEIKLKNAYGNHVATPDRVLFRTKRDGDVSQGRYFSSETLDYLFVQLGLKLVGVDTPSLEPLNKDQNLLTQQLSLSRYFLLNLDLVDAETGVLYNLVAPPVVLPDSPVLPVRAILARV